jgi:hypothetical protein
VCDFGPDHRTGCQPRLRSAPPHYRARSPRARPAEDGPSSVRARTRPVCRAPRVAMAKDNDECVCRGPLPPPPRYARPEPLTTTASPRRASSVLRSSLPRLHEARGNPHRRTPPPPRSDPPRLRSALLPSPSAAMTTCSRWSSSATPAWASRTFFPVSRGTSFASSPSPPSASSSRRDRSRCARRRLPKKKREKPEGFDPDVERVERGPPVSLACDRRRRADASGGGPAQRRRSRFFFLSHSPARAFSRVGSFFPTRSTARR